MNLYPNIVYKDGMVYKVIDIVKVHNFTNKNGSVNQKVLGMYVHEKGGDHVLAKQDKFLICETIEDANIIE